jgi:mono/diheme cytochrome c family protein
VRIAVLASTISVVAFFVVPARGVDGAADSGEAKKIFVQRCAACHTFGKGVKVCADLKGVTERHSRAWLKAFVRSSRAVIESGDVEANALFREFKEQRMPDWSDLSDEQTGAILDWFSANGPEHVDADDRTADQATQGEIDSGQALFQGAARLARGGIACGSCHGVHAPNASAGGTLGPDLTRVYTRYGERALESFLKRPCFRRLPDSTASQYLTPQERFALKSYLRQVALLDLYASGGKQ